jgi:hypothetical protein
MTTMITRWTARLGVLAMATALAAGCGSSGNKPPADGGDGGTPDGSGGGDTAPADGGGDTTTAACTVGGTGQLVLAVAGLPAGTTTPMVRVTGGALAAPMMLTVGSPVMLDARDGYEVDYRRVKTAPVAGSAVGKAFYVSASTFDGCIRSGTTTVTLTYTQEPGSEKLWMTVSNAATLGHVIAGFNGADIAASATKIPTVWKSKNFTGRGAAGAFDFSGNFWVPGGDRINKYPRMTLATTTDAAPEVTLNQPAGASAKFAAFDMNGNLWVSRGNPTTENTVVRYAPADLERTGAPTPAVVISSPDLMNPAGLAFDTNGALWVASEGNDKVLEFIPAHLATSYAGAADVVITGKSGPPVISTFTSPVGLAFDKAGNLWVGYISNTVKITPTQQMTSADLNAPFALTLSTGTGGFVLDESGGLWCPGPGVGKFQRIPAAVLSAASPPVGDVTPDIVIDSAELGSVETLVLDPAPTWSPIHDWL